MSSVCFHSSGSLTYFLPSLPATCVLKRMTYFSMPKILKYFRYISLTALNSCGELLRRAINVRVVHVERAHAHEAEQFARLLVAVAGAVFGQAQRQIAVTARLRRKNAVMMRAVHGFEVITIWRRQLCPLCFWKKLFRWTTSSRRTRTCDGVRCEISLEFFKCINLTLSNAEKSFRKLSRNNSVRLLNGARLCLHIDFLVAFRAKFHRRKH